MLAQDAANREASDLLATADLPTGELRRLTIMVCDLVGSTELSERLDLERYHDLVGTYQHLVREIIEDRYDGHIETIKGDGIFAVFGHPTAHEDDAQRAVQAGLEICRAVQDLSERVAASIGAAVSVRAGVHRGLVFIDGNTGEIYGLAANVASRLEGVADPGRVVISAEVRELVVHQFEVSGGESHRVKGVTTPLPVFAVERELHGAARRSWDTPFMGRGTELGLLRAAWRRARDGGATQAQSILVKGEPGIGKSRLAAALADEVRWDAAPVLRLEASSTHTDAGFHPIRKLLELRCGIGPGIPAPERLSRLRYEVSHQVGPDEVALLAPVLGLSPAAGYVATESEGRKLSEEISQAIRTYLLASLGQGPSLLLVEDAQWLDADTIALLGDLIRSGSAKLLVLLTSRSAAPMVTDMELDLAPLSASECAALVDALATDDLDPAVRETLIQRSDGIPLYLEELLRGGALPSDVRPGAVPEVLYDALVTRLYSTPHGVPVAAAAAAIGRSVDRSMLAAAVDLPEAEIDADLDALVAGRVLTSDESGTYRFRHELLREVAYELQPVSQRQRVHGRIADLLVQRTSDVELVDWPAVAAHLLQAKRPTEAALAYQHASDRARARGAIAEARSQLTRALASIEDLSEDTSHMRLEAGLRLRRGFLAMTVETVGSVDAAEDFARCLELAIVDPHGDDMRSSLIALWSYHLARAELDRADEVAAAFRASLLGERSYLLAAHRAGNGMVQWFRGDFVGARDALEQETENLGADSTNEVDAVWYLPGDSRASTHTFLALSRFMAGDTVGADEQIALCDAVIKSLSFPEGPWSAAYSAWLNTWISTQRGHLDQAASTANAMVLASINHGFDGLTIMGMTSQAAVEATRATSASLVDPVECAAGAATLAGYIDLWQVYELLIAVPYYLTTIATALAAGGDRQGARTRCEEALTLAERTGMHFYDAETRRRLALLTDDPGSRVTQLRRALELARSQGAKPFELRIALDLDEIGAEGGHDALAAVLAAFPDDADLEDLTRARARLAAPA